MSLCLLPALLIRGLVEICLLFVAIRVVTPRHRNAGGLLIAAAALALFNTALAPALDCSGVGFAVGTQGDSALIPYWFLAAGAATLLGPASQALQLTLVLMAVWMLATELPRPDPDRTFGGED